MRECHCPVESDKENLSMPLDEVFSTVRQSVRGLLENGAQPADVSYALAYVGTEMGLLVCKEPAEVFRVVLTSITHASARPAATSSKDADPTDLSTVVPADTDTVH